MHFRSDMAWRWLSGCLIAALLFAQHGALGHALAHFDAERSVAAAAQAEGGSAAHELACAKCLAYAVLDHAAAVTHAAPVAAGSRAAPMPGEPVASLSCTVPAACSRDPPVAFS